VLINLSRRK